ncbi:hypothetical protein GCM10027586_01750 [Kineococcus gypseus]|uniref:cell wall-binding repeat-containing protein n=1 Tax=Kineococcus gypseus TaxID=1637102 RepID=UPI003D7CD9AF
MARTTPRRLRRATATAVLAGAVAAVAVAPADASPTRFHRTFGYDRYATSVVLEDGPLDTAYVVTGERFPDGLTAGAVAGRDLANVYLTPQAQLTKEVRERLVNARRIVVVGSEGAVGRDVMTWLQQNTRAELSRTGGSDRYETAALLSAANYAPGVQDVLIATGEDFPDALAASAAAAKRGVPLLLVRTDAVPEVVVAELKRLAPRSVTLVGGEGTVSAAVQQQLAGTTGAPVRRIAGQDRYGTAVALSREYFTAADTAEAFVVSGAAWADAVTAGAAAGRGRGPLFLTPADCVPQEVNLAVERVDPGTLQVVGGPDRVSEAAAKRTSCGAGVKTYLEDLGEPAGNARYEIDHATLGGVFYPRTVSYDTDPRNSEYRTWSLGTRFERFTAVAGVLDGSTGGLTSRVELFGDEVSLGAWDVSQGRPAVIDVDVRGVDNLKVVTTSSRRTATVPTDNNVYLGDAAVR